jgi:hypothetical protein
VLIVGSELVKETFAGFNSEGIGIVREVTVLEHVVDVIPDRLKRNAKFAVVVHYCFSLAPVLVSLV